MKLVIACLVCIAMAGCATQTSTPFAFHERGSLDAGEKSIVKVARPFAAPGVYLTYVDNKYVRDYTSMKGYPLDLGLEPKSIEVLPGIHSFRANFTYTDLTNKLQVITLLTLVGSSPVAYSTFNKSADLEFLTKPGLTYMIRYTWDQSKGASGVSFLVDECSADEKSCALIPAVQSNETAKLIPKIALPEELMAR